MKTLKLLIFACIIGTFFACESKTIDEKGALVPLTVVDDETLPSITINNVQLHAETFGDVNNPMILMIHGGPGSDYRSILNAKALANDGYFVVFYDQIGSGLSERFDKDIYDTDLFIDEVGEVINYYRQPGQELIILGHSWGAMLAAGYVNEHPENIDGLILLEPGGLNWEDTEDYINRSIKLEVFSETTNDFVYMDQFLTSDEHEMLDYKAGIMTSGNYEKTGDPDACSFWRFGAIAHTAAIDYVKDYSFDFASNLDSYTQNVLFVYSEDNTAYGKEHAELVSAPFNNVTLVEVQDCGHEMVEFGWNNLYPIITNYLNSLN